MNAIDLHGKAAVVTGGARGIGLACAQRLLASGASVMLWDQDEAALKQAVKSLSRDAAVAFSVVDVSDEKIVGAAAAAAETCFGKVDILVNNAGITGSNKPTWEYDPAEWRRVLDIDLTGSFLCARALVPGMMRRGYGRIVNMASVAGKEGNPNAPAYSAAKAGLIGLTKSLGKELANSGVAVNCVTPAAAKTDLFLQMSAAHIEYMKSKIPMNRFVEPAEIAALVAWLCSAECSFSTGAVFDLSGGRATY
ncbi:MAG: 3-oxoacyl-ACP reductase [Betaproteobacteria bacterium RIFCSPLOWO2_02_FULL_62_17]|nr:MAG: 3-oxoacyl-ACP reductase [Betaproteobacteria bacterium RIFCSPLOWO2_02_FULL_62_17]